MTTSRIEAFSDGVFAIAITLLVLNLQVPHVQNGLIDALGKLWPSYLSYVLSFVIIGIIWAQHHRMFRYIHRSNHIFLLVNVIFLMWVSFLPFPTGLLAEYVGDPSEQRTVIAIYSGTFFVGALLFNLLWRYAAHENRLIDPHADPHGVAAITSSYTLGPIVYFADFAIAFISPIASLVVILLFALYWALSPADAPDDKPLTPLAPAELPVPSQSEDASVPAEQGMP